MDDSGGKNVPNQNYNNLMQRKTQLVFLSLVLCFPNGEVKHEYLQSSASRCLSLSSSSHLSVRSLIFFCIRILVLTSWIPASENLDIYFDIKNLLIFFIFISNLKNCSFEFCQKVGSNTSSKNTDS